MLLMFVYILIGCSGQVKSGQLRSSLGHGLWAVGRLGHYNGGTHSSTVVSRWTLTHSTILSVLNQSLGLMGQNLVRLKTEEATGDHFMIKYTSPGKPHFLSLFSV